MARLAGLDQRAGEQARHDLQCHVLEGGSGTVPQLQRVQIVTYMNQRCRTAGEGCLAVSGVAVGHQFLLRVVGQEHMQDARGAHGIALVPQRFNVRLTERGDGFREEQSAVRGKPHFDDLGGGVLFVGWIAGGLIHHGRVLLHITGYRFRSAKHR